MKRLFLALSALMLCIVLLGGCSGGNAPMPDNTGTMLSLSHDNTSTDIPAELLALRFNGYENLSISEYRAKAIDVIAENEAEYLSLIERVSTDSKIQDMRYTNTDAYFVANILIPTIAEKWGAWRFSNFCVGDDCMAEYTVSYSILKADNITMGERNQAISSIMDGIQEVLDSRTGEQLANEIETQAVLDTKINELVRQYTTDSFQIEADLSFRAEVTASTEQPGNQVTFEERGDIGTETDYQLLLSLKTAGYANVSVSDFLQSYVELVQNPDFQEACARVSRDIFCNDVRVDITDEELTFLANTLEATGHEFIATYQRSLELPTLRYRIEKQRNKTKNGHDIIVFDLFIDYSIAYSVHDDTGLTVGERDTILIAIRNDMQDFVDSRTEDELSNGQSALETEIERLEQQYSNRKIQLEINIISYRANDKNDDVQILQ